jgi:hypothetical protein
MTKHMYGANLLEPLDLSFKLLLCLFDLLTHRAQGLRVGSIHLFTARFLLLMGQSIGHSRFHSRDLSDKERGDGFGDILLPLTHAQEFVELYRD